MIKIGIGGADGLNKAWTPEREEKANGYIYAIFSKHNGLEDVALKDLIPVDIKAVWDSFGVRRNKNVFGKTGVALVSGHCPVGDEEWFCVECDDWISSIARPSDELSPLEYHRESGHKMIKVHKDGGVDTFAEIIATALGIQKEIYPADCTFFDNIIPKPKRMTYEECKNVSHPERMAKDHFWKYHFKPRNIKVATVSDIFYDIEPAGSCRHCGGRGKIFAFDGNDKKYSEPCSYCKGTGNYSGATWTKNYAEKLGKEVHQIVIE